MKRTGHIPTHNWAMFQLRIFLSSVMETNPIAIKITPHMENVNDGGVIIVWNDPASLNDPEKYKRLEKASPNILAT